MLHSHQSKMYKQYRKSNGNSIEFFLSTLTQSGLKSLQLESYKKKLTLKSISILSVDSINNLPAKDKLCQDQNSLPYFLHYYPTLGTFLYSLLISLPSQTLLILTHLNSYLRFQKKTCTRNSKISLLKLHSQPMVITIIKVHQQSTIILIGQNIMPILLVTTINMLTIFKRSIRPKNEIFRIEENLEIILTITTILMVMKEFFRIFPTLPTQCNQNFDLLHKIQLSQQAHSLLLPRLLIQVLYHTLFKTILPLLPTQNYEITQFRVLVVLPKAQAKEMLNLLPQQETDLILYYYVMLSTVSLLYSIQSHHKHELWGQFLLEGNYYYITK